MAWKTIDDLDLSGKVVLTRVDINVPVAEGRVTDATRIEKIAPTIHAILAKGGRPVLLAHFDRPKGKVVPEMSVKVTLPALEAAFGCKVHYADDCIGPAAQAVVSGLQNGDVAILENTRFHPGEEKNDPAFAAQLAALGDVFINDAFSVSHRAHASVDAIVRLMPSGAGKQMEAELRALESALSKPKRPVVAVVGGAKVSTKIDLLGNLARKVEHLVIGGGMANTFLVAQGISIGKSLAERDMAETARDILDRARDAGCTIHLPVDIVVANEFREGAPHEVLPFDACPPNAMILDAGPKTIKRIGQVFESCQTLIWNGPLGAFEIAPFDAATNQAAQKAAALTRAGKLITIAGGGDTVAALNRAGAAEDFSYISTAGGAFLEWMEGKVLPGVKALEESASLK